MKYDFATVRLGGFTAPGLPLARWIEFFSITDLGMNCLDVLTRREVLPNRQTSLRLIAPERAQDTFGDETLRVRRGLGTLSAGMDDAAI